MESATEIKYHTIVELWCVSNVLPDTNDFKYTYLGVYVSECVSECVYIPTDLNLLRITLYIDYQMDRPFFSR